MISLSWNIPAAGRPPHSRRWLHGSLLVALAGGVVAGSAPAAAQEPVALAVVDVKLVALGFRVSELIGRPVTNPGGETIGGSTTSSSAATRC